MKRTIRATGYTFALPCVLFGLWWALAQHSQSYFLPDPVKVVKMVPSVWGGPRLTEDVLPSLRRLVAGLGMAIIVGVAAGIPLGTYRKAREVFEPLLEFLRAVPSTVLAPILLLIVGINDWMKIDVIALGCAWPILLNTIEGVRSIDEVMADTAEILRLRRWRRLWYLVLPGAMPRIMAGIRQSLSIGLILMLVSEMFAASNGLGFAVVQFQRIFAIPQMWSGILLLGALGFVIAWIFGRLEKRVLRWYFGLKETTSAG